MAELNPFAQAREAQQVATEVTDSAKDKATEIARTAADKAEGSRGSAAEALHRVAETLHEGADRMPSERVKGIVHAAVNTLEVTRNYVREHDAQAMMGKVKHSIKRYPSQSLLVAFAFGFLVGLNLPFLPIALALPL